MRFYLGTHKTQWLFREQFAGVPLFISHNEMRRRKGMAGAVTRWALDSGGFTQLSKHEEGWPDGCEEPYVEAVYSYMETGTLDFASQQDWMCEPWLMNGRTVREHQVRTVENFLTLSDMAPDIPWLPVLQGWELSDYVSHLQMWFDYGVDLRRFDRVGVGSVCRRQSTDDIGEIISLIATAGISLHGFGVKKGGLLKYGAHLGSADSMAWSFAARHEPPLPECSHGQTGMGKCNNCPRYALKWRAEIVRATGG